MNIDDRPTTDRPQGQFTHFGKTSNDHNSATRQPIPFMFGSRVGSNGAISGWIKFKMAAGGGDIGKLQMAISQQRIMRFTVCMYTDHTLRRSLIYNDGDSKLIS